MVSYELYPRQRSQHSGPPLHVLFQCLDKALTVFNDTAAILRKKADQSFGDSSGYNDGILRIEPIMRVGRAMRMTALALNVLTAHFKQRDSNGRVRVSLASAHDAPVPALQEQTVQPVIVAETNAHDETRIADLSGIFWLRLESFWIGRGGHDRFNLDEIAANSGGE